ncbi:cytochrome c [Hymenobacter oligotrophus]|uniref:Cytochrome c n=1 Tax=Hymenobacter oligotrophus TaxID=2319843 RepID=A0A3B7QY82_9BACT|nr:cytochrome c [Hymenobacter oligotrophus]AYA36193.1 cytochrome c [Hymenobacter oligotrophus]
MALRPTPALLRSAVLLAAAALALPSCFTDRQNEGQKLYANHCASCHGDQGQGLRRLIPPVAGADYLTKYRADLPCLIRRGQQGPIVVNGVHYNQVMPGHEDLTDSQITNLLNYVQSAWGNKGEKYTIREVSELLDRCQGSDGQ